MPPKPKNTKRPFSAKASQRGRFKGKNQNQPHPLNIDLSILHEPLFPVVKKEPFHGEPWLDKLKPIIKTDEEEHIRIMTARHEKRNQKVFSYCQEELNSILKYSLILIDNKKNPNFCQSRENHIIRSHFRQGTLCEPKKSSSNSLNSEGPPHITPISPIHSLDINHYVHNSSTLSLWEDLSKLFNISISEDNIQDSNPVFNSLLQKLQHEASIMKQPFQPFNKLSIPFIIPIVGFSGRTTICQLLSLVFDIDILDIIITPEPKKKV